MRVQALIEAARAVTAAEYLSDDDWWGALWAMRAAVDACADLSVDRVHVLADGETVISEDRRGIDFVMHKTWAEGLVVRSAPDGDA